MLFTWFSAYSYCSVYNYFVELKSIYFHFIFLGGQNVLFFSCWHEFCKCQKHYEFPIHFCIDFQRANINRIDEFHVPKAQGIHKHNLFICFLDEGFFFRFVPVGAQHRIVSGQAFVVYEHANQTGHIGRRLRCRGDRQPRVSGRLFQLFHTANASGRQRRRNQLVLRLVPAGEDVVDPREYCARAYGFSRTMVVNASLWLGGTDVRRRVEPDETRAVDRRVQMRVVRPPLGIGKSPSRCRRRSDLRSGNVEVRTVQFFVP